MSTLMEQTSEKETKQLHNNHNDEEIEIDLMDLLRKVIGIRKKIYKAAGIGLIIGVIVAISIPKQYTVEVTLSPEMGNNKGGGLSGLAASFLGSGVTMGDGTDALNASLSADIVSSTPFLSSPLNGSSSIRRSGFSMIACAIPRRCFIPKEYLATAFFESGSRPTLEIVFLISVSVIFP